MPPTALELDLCRIKSLMSYCMRSISCCARILRCSSIDICWAAFFCIIVVLCVVLQLLPQFCDVSQSRR